MTNGRPRPVHSGSAAIFAICVVTVCNFLVTPVAHATQNLDCHIGTYRLADGGFLDIAPSEGKTLRWRRVDGTTGALTDKGAGLWTSTYGWTGRPDGKTARFSTCAAARIDFDGVKGQRVAFDTTDTWRWKKSPTPWDCEGQRE